jgi:hypothetical protein
MKTAAQIAAILAADVADMRTDLKITADIFDAMRPGTTRFGWLFKRWAIQNGGRPPF